MKLVRNIFILNIFILLSCSVPKFKRVNEDEYSKYDLKKTIHLDSSYTLYMRQVVKRPINGIYKPVSVRNVKSGDIIIEQQYLFINKQNKEIIIMNQIPSAYVSFYNTIDQDKIALFPEIFKIDIWYLNQIRFGKYIDKSTIIFDKVVDGLPQKWEIINFNKKIELLSVSEYTYQNEHKRMIDPAYSVKLEFFEINNYQIIFRNNRNKKNTDNLKKIEPEVREEYQIENDVKIVRLNKSLNIVFKLISSTDSLKFIVFGPDRLYSLPDF